MTNSAGVMTPALFGDVPILDRFLAVVQL